MLHQHDRYDGKTQQSEHKIHHRIVALVFQAKIGGLGKQFLFMFEQPVSGIGSSNDDGDEHKIADAQADEQKRKQNEADDRGDADEQELADRRPLIIVDPAECLDQVEQPEDAIEPKGNDRVENRNRDFLEQHRFHPAVIDDENVALVQLAKQEGPQRRFIGAGIAGMKEKNDAKEKQEENI